jgi:uncharacterized protein YlxW (UPF0749 family)
MTEEVNNLIDDNKELLIEVKGMLKAVIDGQAQLLKEVRELREEQKKLHEEIRASNFILNQINVRSEILN